MKGPKFAALLLFFPGRLAAADVAHIDADRAARGEPPYTAEYRPELLLKREALARDRRRIYGRALLLIALCAAVGAAAALTAPLRGWASTVVLGVSGCLAVLATLGAVESVTVGGECPIDHGVRWLYRATYGLSVALLAWGTVSQALAGS